MTRQCLAQRRIPTIEELDREIRAWAESINLKQKGVRWHMTIDDALGGTVPWPTINAFMVAISLRPTQLGRWSQKIG